MTIKVLVREPEWTEVEVSSRSHAKAFASQLIRDGKAFSFTVTDGALLFTVYEINWPNKWEAA